MHNENDPDGTYQHAPGAKLDAGKNRLGLVLGDFSRALEAVGQIGTFGANKYSERGWMKVPNAESRYKDAMMRHLFKDFQGQAADRESGLDHLAHAAWNMLAILELRKRVKKQTP